MISAKDFHLAPIKVLMIEDDADVGAALVGTLERSGMLINWAMTAAAGLAVKPSFCPDVVLVDLGLPDMDGMGLVKILVAEGDCGIIIVSGLNDEAARIAGLEMGADDYVAKPPRLRELRARIHAVHRRMTMRSVAKTDPVRAVIQLGKIEVDLAGHAVRSEDGSQIALTNTEFVALEVLIAASGEPVSRDRLSETALLRPWHSGDRSVDQLIFNLRQKLANGDRQQLIHSVRGAGYLLTLGNSLEDQMKAPLRSLTQSEGLADALPAAER